MCKYIIHYFSGTGNTYHMVKLSVLKLAVFIIAGLIPIWLIIDLNNYVGHLLAIVNVILCLIICIFSTVFADVLIGVMEKTKVFRKLFRISYTKYFRRNIAKGFKNYEL